MVEVSPPRHLPAASAAGVGLVMRRRRPTCLPRSLLRQAWLAAQGNPQDLIVGVSTDGGFDAHAWLADEAETDGAGFVEMTRRPPAG